MWGCIVLLPLTFSFVQHVHFFMSVLCPYEHIMSIEGNEVPKQAGKNVRDRTGPNFVTDYAPVPVRTLRNHSPAHVFWVSQPKRDTEFRDGRSSALYMQLWIYNVVVSGWCSSIRYMCDHSNHTHHVLGPNFVTEYVPVPVRTLRNQTPVHVFLVLHPKPDTEFRDGMISWVGIVFLRTKFSGRIS